MMLVKITAGHPVETGDLFILNDGTRDTLERVGSSVGAIVGDDEISMFDFYRPVVSLQKLKDAIQADKVVSFLGFEIMKAAELAKNNNKILRKEKA